MEWFCFGRACLGTLPLGSSAGHVLDVVNASGVTALAPTAASDFMSYRNDPLGTRKLLLFISEPEQMSASGRQAPVPLNSANEYNRPEADGQKRERSSRLAALADSKLERMIVNSRPLAAADMLATRASSKWKLQNATWPTIIGTNKMLVYIFRGPGRVFGFTTDMSGTNLPVKFAPWNAFKSVTLNRNVVTPGVDANECLDDIEDHGFHITDAHVRVTDKAI